MNFIFLFYFLLFMRTRHKFSPNLSDIMLTSLSRILVPQSYSFMLRKIFFSCNCLEKKKKKQNFFFSKKIILDMQEISLNLLYNNLCMSVLLQEHHEQEMGPCCSFSCIYFLFSFPFLSTFLLIFPIFNLMSYLYFVFFSLYLLYQIIILFTFNVAIFIFFFC